MVENNRVFCLPSRIKAGFLAVHEGRNRNRGTIFAKFLPLMLSLFLIILYLGPAAAGLDGEIIVKQDRNGNIIVTNTPYTPPQTHFKKPAPLPPETDLYSLVPDKYSARIKELSSKHQVKEELIIAVVQAESGFNPHAVSRKGAVGLMQLMKDTAIQYGVRNRYDADQNLQAGVRHLRYLLGKYQQDLSLVLAAYNAGEEAVKKYNGIPPYEETRTYIRRVMKYMGMNPGGYLGSARKSKIYKIIAPDGKVTITDVLPSKVVGTVITFD